MNDAASAPMRPICVVAACALRSRVALMRSLRCSAAPSIWTTCAPNLTPFPSGALLGRLPQVRLDDARVGPDLGGVALRDLLPVVEDDDLLRDAHDQSHVVLDEEDGDVLVQDLVDQLHQVDLLLGR